MGQACSGRTDVELEHQATEISIKPTETAVVKKKFNAEKYNSQLGEIEDPQAKETCERVLDFSDADEASNKLFMIVKLQLRFKHIMRVQRARAIASSNQIRELSDSIANGSCPEHTNEVV